jgi:hypothetical protein
MYVGVGYGSRTRRLMRRRDRRRCGTSWWTRSSLGCRCLPLPHFIIRLGEHLHRHRWLPLPQGADKNKERESNCVNREATLVAPFPPALIVDAVPFTAPFSPNLFTPVGMEPDVPSGTLAGLSLWLYYAAGTDRHQGDRRCGGRRERGRYTRPVVRSNIFGRVGPVLGTDS